MHNAFSIKESIIFGWHKVKAHSGLVFGAVLALALLQFASSAAQKTFEGSMLGLVISILLAFLGVVLGAGTTLIFLKLAKGEHAQYRDIIPSARLIWKYFAASFLSGVIAVLPIMAGGLVALGLLISTGAANFSEGGAPVVSSADVLALAGAVLVMAAAFAYALYLALRYSMARLAVLDGADIIESLRMSTRLTRGVKRHLALFTLAVIALNILGLVVFIAGLLVSVPVSLIAYAHVYLKLKAHRGHH